ncbi:MAG: hypothetical protein ABI175_28265 [Polyangiales bacterium]
MRTTRSLVFLALVTCFIGCSSSSSSNGAGEPAALSEYCKKCAACVNEAGFDEGFCTPFKKTGSFDTLECSSKGDVAQLKDHTLSAVTIAGMTCKAFDDAE